MKLNRNYNYNKTEISETKLDLYPDLTVKERGEKWAFWSTKEQQQLYREGKGDRPQTIEDTADMINSDNNKELHDHFGWRVAYFMFKFGTSYEELKEEKDFRMRFESTGRGRRA